MSISPPPRVASIDSVDVDVPSAAADVFPDLIERNDAVCRNCYRRLARREEFPREVGYRHRDIHAFVEEVVPDGSDRFAVLDREYYETTLEEPRNLRVTPPDDSRASTSSRACWSCGAIDHHRTPAETRSKAEAIEIAFNISQTLVEFDVAHDWLLLVELVKQLKSSPSFAGDDFAVFKQATEKAVEKVQMP